MNQTLHAAFFFLLLIIASSSFCQENNFAPEITGQIPSPLTVAQGSAITIELNNLIVDDADPSPVYPDGFTLDVSPGENYNVQGTTVTPDETFTGTLAVLVRVNDGQNNSDYYELLIDVTASQNIAPQITGQSPLSVNENESLTIELSHLQVTDPDNTYPAEFTLQVFAGSNYTFS
ncbi:MAG TPA: hypothetical protein VJ184_04690, partial [Chryseolinea sp.]|nr:hypothetical protein [Chryseolinea sp.]